MENEFKYSEEIEKVVNAENRECLLYGTEACRYINAESCGECSVGSLKPAKQEKAKAALERLAKAAPEELVSKYYSGDECIFCKGEKEKAECFALFDLSKPDPEGGWSVALGKKTLDVRGADMILPVQASCCKKCRRAYRLYDWLPVCIALVFAAAGLAVSAMKPVYKAAYELASWLPPVIFAGFVVLGVLIALILKLILGAALRKRMTTDVSELEETKPLTERGFEEVAPKKHGVSRLVFSPEFRKYGVGSRMPEKPEGGEEPHLMGIWPAEVPPEFEGGEGTCANTECVPDNSSEDDGREPMLMGEPAIEDIRDFEEPERISECEPALMGKFPAEAPPEFDEDPATMGIGPVECAPELSPDEEVPEDEYASPQDEHDSPEEK